ncbi:batten's disease protein Cln3 [Boletus edulis BED1]|uniref:Protein BTN n=1 Tax=Boletus edulis BED1 TaxID=1328754 RepID=A0AAD4GN77_BOLED|nr:batten's disease protein Cln3 [Boletus edulis BED1]
MSLVLIRSREDSLEEISSDKPQGWKRKLLKLGISFFLFGLINNVLYVIILSAALDLVPPSTPKGIIAFCNIFPALLAKLGWPYFLKGKIRYSRRIVGCALLSFIGMLIVALYDSLPARLLGISIASFSSGLGELTFLQLSITYNLSLGGQSVGYFASGTGAAGLVGAFMWWEVRGLGVRLGVGVSAILPFVLPLTYFLLLPRPPAFMDSPSPGSYTPLPEEDPDIHAVEVAEGDTLLGQPPKVPVFLTAGDKWRLVKPMVLKYMLPLFLVYTFEYTINQGVAPTLLYPVPSPRDGILSKIIHSIRDYYPLWQLVYQSTVFISRSSISLGIPPLPETFLSFPAVAQFLILVTLMYESAVGIFSEDHPSTSIIFVFLLISIEGICGGLAYVNVFYRINQERPDPSTVIDMERSRQELEFKIGSLGFSDSSGILFAALLAVPTELELCRAQVARMKMLCKGL